MQGVRLPEMGWISWTLIVAFVAGLAWLAFEIIRARDYDGDDF